MIEIWTAGTTNGQRVSIMLEELGLPYQAHAVDIHAPVKPPELLAINPSGAIPAFRDSVTGVALSQSFAIMQHLCEREGRFAPRDPLVLQWMSMVMTDVTPATHPIFIINRAFPGAYPDVIALYETRLLRFLGLVDTQLAATPYLAGDEITVADFALYPTVAFRTVLLDRAGGLPHLRGWMLRLAARPGVAAGMQVPKK